ncbi:unnamed protein product (macronuclear) [Paramecium tetraurelia]|uniref:Transmembrane protein n=1 Tax=Paramecium tetraurelia TaxID=5888 RepID=A0BWF3_PARTE|nr:uncharacterized protein GSPATT00032722001 [Paramecium tetraurelia]CAK62870.1 unnamed protein product [Paramecium tetraurelia]|eukprot:XP_001430268.1 hypothetical protein (macronuclear) [Paramecium tetraurelia strain d4-2]
MASQAKECLIEYSVTGKPLKIRILVQFICSNQTSWFILNQPQIIIVQIAYSIKNRLSMYKSKFRQIFSQLLFELKFTQQISLKNKSKNLLLLREFSANYELYGEACHFKQIISLLGCTLRFLLQLSKEESINGQGQDQQPNSYSP